MDEEEEDGGWVSGSVSNRGNEEGKNDVRVSTVE